MDGSLKGALPGDGNLPGASTPSRAVQSRLAYSGLSVVRRCFFGPKICHEGPRAGAMCAPQNIRAGQPVLAIEETGKRLSFNARPGTP